MKQSVAPLEVLNWLADIGADEAVGEYPSLAQWVSPSRIGSVTKQTPRVPTTAFLSPKHPLDCAALGPRFRSNTSSPPVKIEAESLPALRSELEAFDGCPLKTTAMNLVFGEGPVQAKLMVIGDSPSEDDDRQGRPFTGQTGALLDQIFASIGMKREEVYISPLLFWRPPGNRSPTNEEVEACLPFVERQIAIVQPKVLFTLGATPSKYLLRTKEGFTRLRGRWQSYNPPLAANKAAEIPCLPLYHPSYLLRQPTMKRLLWIDLLNFMNEKDSIFR